jgi:HK97 gp10 family phage protein
MARQASGVSKTFDSRSVGEFLTVNVDGLAELEANLRALPEDLAKKALGMAARKAMRLLQRRIANSAPMRTGQLKRGVRIRSAFTGDGVRGGTINVSIGVVLKPKEESAFYGKFLELGTVKMNKHPFMKPEFDAGAPEVIRQFAVELDAAIERVARKARVRAGTD